MDGACFSVVSVARKRFFWDDKGMRGDASVSEYLSSLWKLSVGGFLRKLCKPSTIAKEDNQLLTLHLSKDRFHHLASIGMVCG